MQHFSAPLQHVVRVFLCFISFSAAVLAFLRRLYVMMCHFRTRFVIFVFPVVFSGLAWVVFSYVYTSYVGISLIDLGLLFWLSCHFYSVSQSVAKK